MMFVYVLQSRTTSRYYVGSTQDITNRLMEHNSGECKGTRNGIPWELVHLETYVTRVEAVGQERRIKSRGIARYLNGLKTAGS